MNIIQIFKFDLNFHLNFDDIHTQYIEFREISSENIWERQIWYQLSQKLRQIDTSRFLHVMADIPEKSHHMTDKVMRMIYQAVVWNLLKDKT